MNFERRHKPVILHACTKRESMKKIALMEGLNWIARRPPTVPVPQVRTLLVGESKPPVQEEIERQIHRLATSSAEAKQQRLAAQKRKQKRGY
ncbi:hypothetical protein [Pantoea agglomerans]|uniref:hypothetical protein n=2 Tax=Enterobacter agglomerans TaxID=549 RepID=UPI003C7C49CD